MKAHILTPRGPVFEGEVEGVRMPGIQGGFEVLKDHAPLVSILDIGKLVVRISEEPELTYAISGGFTEIKDNNVIVMAEDAVPSEKIDTESERARESELEQELKKYKIFTADHKRIQRQLRIVKNLLQVAGS
jgi:F-type H+-transporting ATPase subunit epsilon